MKFFTFLFILLSPSVFALPPAAPANPTGFSASPGDTKVTLSWTNPGVFDEVMVVASTVAITAVPTGTGAAYTADLNFGLGTAIVTIPTAEYVVYKGTGTSAVITALTNGTAYNFKIYSRGGTGGAEWSAGVTASATPCAPANPTGFAPTAANGQISLAWTNPGSCFDNVIVVAGTASITAVPTNDGSAYTANNTFGSGTEIVTDEFVVYKGTGTSITVNTLDNGIMYYFKIFTRKTTDWSAGTQVSATPMPQPVTSGSFSPSCFNAGNVSWTNPGTVNTILVFAKAGSAITLGSPTNNVSAYTASTTFGSGTAYEGDASAFCVYKGNSNSVSISGLTGGTDYHFLVYNVDTDVYSTDHTFNNSTPSGDITGLTDTPSANQIVLNWTNPSCSDAIMVVASTGPITAMPSGNGGGYSANNTFGAGTQIVTGPPIEYVVYKNSGTSVTVNTLNPGTVYNFKVFNRKGTVWSAGVTLTSATTGVTITTGTATATTTSFTSISNIVLTENSKGDFHGNGTYTLKLGISGGGYIFDTGAPAPSVTRTPGKNITSIGAVVVDFTSVEITYSVVGTDEIDALTISGLRVKSSSFLNPNRDIIRIAGASDGTIDNAAINAVLGTISSCPTTPPTTAKFNSASPTPATISICSGEAIPFATIDNSIDLGTIRWYADPSLTDLKSTSLTPSAAQLGLINTNVTTSPTQQTIYVTRFDAGCESAAATIVLTVNPKPKIYPGADESVCSGTTVTLGGTPSLVVPTAPGTYQYDWICTSCALPTDVTYAPDKLRPNPTVTLTNGTTANISYTFELTVKDPNNCLADEYDPAQGITKTVIVKPSVVPQLTQPNSTTFGTSTPPVLLSATPAGGVFSGVGVVKTQTSPDVYKFSAVLANNPNAPPNTPQTYDLYYSVTDPGTGCSVNNYQIAVMTLSNQLFSNLSSEYCSSEHPTPNGNVNYLLKADGTTQSNINNEVNSWNTNTRFYYGPLAIYSAPWYNFLSYAINARVHYNGEAYVAIAASLGAPPNLNPAAWLLVNTGNTLKVEFRGTVRNYYEGYYGGNKNNPTPTNPATIVATGNTYSGSLKEYEMLTNIDYKECSTCDYSYPAFYLNFINDNDIKHLVSTWSPSSYYYPGSVVLVGSNYYRLRLTYDSSPNYSFGDNPVSSPTIWEDTNSFFDSGSQYQSATGSGFYTRGQYVTIHKNPLASFTGLTSGLVNATEFCNTNTNYVLTGNSNGQSGLGAFDMSFDPTNFQTYASSLTDGNPGPGQATFNSANAYSANSLSNKLFYIRYRVDPGTKGSDGLTACYGVDTQIIHINSKPGVSFVSPTPMGPGQFFCFNETAVDIKATSSASVTLTGFGVTDVGTGNGKFDPATAITQLSTATGITYTYVNRPTIDATAIATDVNGCVGEAVVSFVVHPLPPATVAPYSNNLCYTTAPFLIDGQQTNAYWTIDYKDLSHTVSMGSTSSPHPDINTFNPQALFKDAVDNFGANPLATLSFDLTYTSYDPDECLNSLAPVTVKIAPQIPVTIAGVNNNEEFCSNLTAKQITLSPTGGNLTITRNGSPIATPTVVDGQFFFSPIPLSGGDYVFNYDVITGNNCSNPQTANVKVLASPIATFVAPPKCEGDVISFNADGVQNTNGTPTYTWTLEGGQVVSQNTTHKFSGVGTYTVNLNVSYPAAGTTNTVCSSTLSLDQYVGLIPVVDFDVADVCVGDATRFIYSSSVTPISQAQWDFGDGSTLALGSVNQTVPVGGNTSGTYGNPVHSFSGGNTYTVTLTGRTSDLTGSCANSKTRAVSILEYLKSFTPNNPYSMKALNSENGFWVVEDKRTNSTWEFAAPSKGSITSPNKAWVTNATGYYKSNDQSYVNSPCLDLSAFTKPSISVNYRYNTDPRKDGAVLQYSIDGGATWIRLGDMSSGLNWYNEQNISASPGGQNAFGWSGTGQTDWQVGKNSLNVVAEQPKVRFRIAFASDEKDTLGGFAFNDLKIEERNRLTLIESFTNVNAANANANKAAFQAISESETVKIEYHTASPANDPIYPLNTADFNSRAAFYGLTNTNVSVPRGFIDGISNGALDAPWAISYQPLRSLVSASFAIDIENPVSVNPDEITARITLTSLSDIPEGKFDLQIAITEKQVGSDKFILRKMLPSAAGTRLQAPMAKGTSTTITESWSVKNIVSSAELAIVAFVQDQTSLEVLQAAQLSSLTNPPTVITGIGESLFNDEARIYPNPADREFTLQLPSSLKQDGVITISDQLGKAAFTSSFSAGSKTKTINTRDLAEGLYILKLESGKQTIHQKVVIVHKQ